MRGNPFAAYCKYGNNVHAMLFSNCNLFKRSFSNIGLGFSFNNELRHNLYKNSSDNHLLLSTLMVSDDKKVSMMESASSKKSLKVMIENNFEESKFYEDTKITEPPKGILIYKPRKIKVTLHEPKEPANIRSKSFNIPLGQSSRVYIFPKATRIDESGKALTEDQRECRLSEDNKDLDIFNIYTQEGCIQECKIRQAFEACGCIPWDYLTVKVCLHGKCKENKVASIFFKRIFYCRTLILFYFVMFMEIFVLKNISQMKKMKKSAIAQ